MSPTYVLILIMALALGTMATASIVVARRLLPVIVESRSFARTDRRTA